jgi:hypothetical protein
MTSDQRRITAPEDAHDFEQPRIEPDERRRPDTSDWFFHQVPRDRVDQ